MKALVVLTASLLAATSAFGQNMPKKVLVIPLDDRPVSVQMPEMLGAIGDIAVETPPVELLGHFDKPGSPEGIVNWLRSKGGIGEYDAVILSLDMVGFGGLIASRAANADYDTALRRIKEFWNFRLDAPKTKIFAFSTIMRLAPTATKETAGWRLLLAKFAELKEKTRVQPTPQNKQALQALQAKIPSWEIEKYEGSRRRNHKLQKDCIQMLGLGAFDHLAFGQDDASPVGPHQRETLWLKQAVQGQGTQSRTSFIMGIDQVPGVLLARTVTEAIKWKPRVKAVYADDLAKLKTAPYESAPIQESLRQQVETSGCTLSNTGDLTFFINTPGTTIPQLNSLVAKLNQSLDSHMPTLLADINLGKSGTPDERLIASISKPSIFTRLIGFAGWNTAANTMGTALPAAVIYEAARRTQAASLNREVQLKRFNFHRLVSDWQYHKFTRPLAYGMIDQMPTASREELYGDDLNRVSELVKKDLTARAEQSFQTLLAGQVIEADGVRQQITELDDIRIGLPWPRAYEVSVDFKIGVQTLGAAKSK